MKLLSIAVVLCIVLAAISGCASDPGAKFVGEWQSVEKPEASMKIAKDETDKNGETYTFEPMMNGKAEKMPVVPKLKLDKEKNILKMEMMGMVAAEFKHDEKTGEMVMTSPFDKSGKEQRFKKK